MKINKIHARQILDSRGYPTVEADVFLEDQTLGRAAVPSGTSIGINEALELRDNDKSKFGGKSVYKAVENINNEIAKSLIGFEVEKQEDIDQKLIELDATENKSRLGANAILAVSLAWAHASANFKKIPLFKYINLLASKPVNPTLPIPLFNIINGGKHADWAFDIQEFMIIPIGAKNFTEILQMGTTIYHKLAQVLKTKGYSVSVGDEGGYAPKVQKGNREPLELIIEAIEKAGYRAGKDIALGLDLAASEFFQDGKYHLKTEGKILGSDQMISYLEELVKDFPIISIEDGLDQQDWEGWKNLTTKLGEKIQIIGDDIFVTNLKFLEKGIKQKSANAILIKLNQISTLTETIKAIEFAQSFGWKTVISHRSGETEDTTIAHLAVGLATGQIKSGSVCRGERICKYNELLRIEEILKTGSAYGS